MTNKGTGNSKGRDKADPPRSAKADKLKGKAKAKTTAKATAKATATKLKLIVVACLPALVEQGIEQIRV
jgi:hypothetical protein